MYVSKHIHTLLTLAYFSSSERVNSDPSAGGFQLSTSTFNTTTTTATTSPGYKSHLPLTVASLGCTFSPHRTYISENWPNTATELLYPCKGVPCLPGSSNTLRPRESSALAPPALIGRANSWLHPMPPHSQRVARELITSQDRPVNLVNPTSIML